MQSSTLTSSDSVELQMFSFCLVEVTIENPPPMENPPPIWPCMLGMVAEGSVHIPFENATFVGTERGIV